MIVARVRIGGERTVATGTPGASGSRPARARRPSMTPASFRKRCSRVAATVAGTAGPGAPVPPRQRAEPAAHVAVGPPPGARAAAARVEQRLVADHAALDLGDAGRGDVGRQRAEGPVVERRVAAADEVQVARQHAVLADDRARRGTDGRLQRALRPEAQERGGGRRQLLVGRRDARDVRPAREERGAALEVDDVGARGAAEPRGLLREALLQRLGVERARRRGREDDGGGGEHAGGAEAERHGGHGP